jgi:signal transduction histidine kinase
MPFWPLKFEEAENGHVIKKEKKNYKTLQYTTNSLSHELRTPVTIIVAIDT